MRIKSSKNTRVVFLTCSILIGMFCLAFASVPLYDLFCKVTGYGGTVQQASTIPLKVTDSDIKIRFNTDVSKNLVLDFSPLKRQIVTKIGKSNTVNFRVFNTGSEKIIATSTYNVTPQKAGIYFNKLDCFCYEEKLILPGQEMVLPVSFFISPEFLDDPGTKELKSVTLSYTFFNGENLDYNKIN